MQKVAAPIATPVPTATRPAPFSILSVTVWGATYRCEHCGGECEVDLQFDDLDASDPCCPEPPTPEQEQAIIQAITEEREPFNASAYV